MLRQMIRNDRGVFCYCAEMTLLLIYKHTPNFRIFYTENRCDF